MNHSIDRRTLVRAATAGTGVGMLGFTTGCSQEGGAT